MHKKKFDIAAKLVSPETRAWVIHAGRSQLNYADFNQNNIVFLEAPYLELNKQTLATRSAVRQAVRRSLAWRRHAETTGSQPPSAALSGYSDAVFSDTSLQALSGSISRLYGQAKVGDIIAVPGRDVYEGIPRPIIKFGEIISDFNESDVYSGVRLANQSVPVRRVKWLNNVPRKSVSLHLERKIGKPPAVREIKIEKDTEELLKHAYESYIFEGNSSGLVIADKYDGSDFIVLNKSSELIAFLVSAHAAFVKGTKPAGQITDIEKFTEQFFKQASVENIEVDFASPGYWRIIGATVSLAAFVGLGVAVLSSGLSANDLALGIEVTNSVSPADPTAKAMEDSMNMFLQSVDRLELDKAVKSATDAKQIIGLQSSTKPVN
ncbi:hypothetical protein [Agrobacterium sp.]|uniref:hypothetical protein n=1 Tax=Agrobacterium sp. TaxID=361 RepID=UPI0028B0E212